MINQKQFKTSIILGGIYTTGYIIFKIVSLLLGNTNDVYLLFFQDKLWYIPLILLCLTFLVSSSCFYLLFRIGSFLCSRFK